MTSATTATMTTTRAVSGRSKAANFVATLSKLDQGMKLDELQVLFHVAQHQDQEGGLTTADMKEALGFSNPIVSRLTYYWADGVYGVPGTGLGMIDVTIDSTDRCQTSTHPKGQRPHPPPTLLHFSF